MCPLCVHAFIIWLYLTSDLYIVFGSAGCSNSSTVTFFAKLFLTPNGNLSFGLLVCCSTLVYLFSVQRWPDLVPLKVPDLLTSHQHILSQMCTYNMLQFLMRFCIFEYVQMKNALWTIYSFARLPVLMFALFNHQNDSNQKIWGEGSPVPEDLVLLAQNTASSFDYKNRCFYSVRLPTLLPSDSFLTDEKVAHFHQSNLII